MTRFLENVAIYHPDQCGEPEPGSRDFLQGAGVRAGTKD